ncbi:MAG: metal-sensitive transcriptional regulator [Drouetiella hepatica Uher 2000/2452]|jgi:DNA-binding FrmR family transcriptional regulator|uniref:Metal-sensitive transcriptional regulator n=1 Tax=Drouetiella hepatica Uher 2000/2452 TaxID=904376 RepID=A0A951UKE2_9CYAN|nr:metal-sensitive transcriptional regulator [Drouetiella hepatica Uher 2000/2452]
MATSELSAQPLDPLREDKPGDRSHRDHGQGDQDHEEHSHEGEAIHVHVHSDESLRRIVNRLSRIEGHIRGIKTMVQESRPCPDVLVQIAAVRGAIDRVSRVILDEHLTECVARAAKEGNIEAEIEELKTALDRFLP